MSDWNLANLVSKKLGVIIIGLVVLERLKAPSWQVLLVIVVYMVIQGFLDLQKIKKGS